MSELKGLVLAGGLSSRMGQDKGSLEFRGETLRARAARHLASVCNEVFVSLRPDQASAEGLPALYDTVADIGPAAGLLSARRYDPSVSWLILACDFPLAEVASVEALAKHHVEDGRITCFVGIDENPEPLFAIWPASALQLLQLNVSTGQAGPMATLLQSSPRLIAAANSDWLLNTNDLAQFRNLSLRR